MKNEMANDFVTFFPRHPKLRRAAFNGAKAEAAFKKKSNRKRSSNTSSAIRSILLPSTSPTPGRHVESLDEKVPEWKTIRDLAAVALQADRSYEG